MPRMRNRDDAASGSRTGPIMAVEVPYLPDDPTDWNDDADPGTAADALDQIGLNLATHWDVGDGIHHFNGSVLFAGTDRLYWRDAQISAYSPSDGNLTIRCDDTATFRGSAETVVGVAGDIKLGDGAERDMHPETTLKVNLGTSAKRFNDVWAGGGVRTKVSTDNVTTPTDAELDTAFGTPAAVGAGFMGIVDDNGAGTAVFLCVSDGANWWYEALTKAT